MPFTKAKRNIRGDLLNERSISSWFVTRTGNLSRTDLLRVLRMAESSELLIFEASAWLGKFLLLLLPRFSLSRYLHFLSVLFFIFIFYIWIWIYILFAFGCRMCLEQENEVTSKQASKQKKNLQLIHARCDAFNSYCCYGVAPPVPVPVSVS